MRNRFGIGAPAAVFAAIALVSASTVIGMSMHGSGSDETVRVDALGHEFVAKRETMKAAEWFGERGRLFGLKFAADAGSDERLRLRLVPSEGVAIPSGSFEASAIRFNDAGEVIEIVPADPTAGCQVVAFEDPEDPGHYLVGCSGTCNDAALRCTLAIDIVTLELACPCM
jgi:hypothetical protein